jgi:collagen beta-1,O-galactosyltransferase
MLSASGLAKVLGVGFERAIIPVDELLPALYMPHPREDVRRRYPPRLNAYAFDPALVTQLPKEIAGSDTEATADYPQLTA